MYGLTRGPITLVAAGTAGLLVWIATQINERSTGGYWAVNGIIAGAGLVMALSQLLGGWTKWGWPRLSQSVLLIAFLPAAVCFGWIVVAGQPHANTLQSHVLTWSGDIGIRGLVTDLLRYLGVLAFGLGLVFGFSFDTTGPPRPAAPSPDQRDWRRTAVAEPTPADGATAVVEREPVGTTSDSTTTVMPAPPAATPEPPTTPVGPAPQRSVPK